jgi:hypothetical protein
VTQDIRLVSGGDGPMAFTLGGFFGSERVFNATNLRVYQDIDFNLDGALDFQDCLTAGPPAGCQTQNSFNQNRTSWAIYTDGRYDLGGGFALRAGARFSHDTGRQYDIISQMIGSDDVVLANLIPGDANNVDATTSQKFSKSNVSGKIGLDYSFDDNLLYLSYSRGYRASSFAAQAFFTPDELTVARPETVDSIEGGFKLDLLDRRLRLNGALFHYSYRDQQFIDVEAEHMVIEPCQTRGDMRQERPAVMVEIDGDLVTRQDRYIRALTEGEDLGLSAMGEDVEVLASKVVREIVQPALEEPSVVPDHGDGCGCHSRPVRLRAVARRPICRAWASRGGRTGPYG